MRQKNKKYFYGTMTIAIFLIVGYYVHSYDVAHAPQPSQPAAQSVQPTTNNQTPAPSQNQDLAKPVPASNQASAKAAPPPVAAPENQDMGASIQVAEVDFNGSRFAPQSVTIHSGDYIFFENKSAGNFWPTADIGGYPGFDAGSAIAPQKEFRFQFIKVGTWKYHDGITTSAIGVVNVTQ